MMVKSLTFFIFMQRQEAKVKEWNGEGDFNLGWHDGLFFWVHPLFSPQPKDLNVNFNSNHEQ
jgi:hypothetical protein